VTPVLQTLAISDGTGPRPETFLDHVSPLTTLVRFKRLRVLEVPHEALIGSPGTSRAPVTSMLPASLQMLKFHTPFLSILPLLDEIPPLRKHFPNLCEIDLQPRDTRGEDYEAFHYRRYATWDRLLAMGIDVSVWWHEDDYCEAWDDE
jgi:hypothetical protein